jgi:hypothetical protein
VESSFARVQVASRPPDFDVPAALEEWRRHVLTWLGEELRQSGQDRMEAADGLSIAHRNSGEIDSDVVDLLWNDLQVACIRQCRLERVIGSIEAMAIPELLMLFLRSTKVKTYRFEAN